MKTLLQFIVTVLILFTFSTDLSAQMKFKDLVGHPVLSYGDPGKWDDGTVVSPAVIKDGDTLRMWYNGFNGDLWTPSAEGKIGYAWSTDGITWNKYSQNPVLYAEFEWEGDDIFRCAVMKEADTLKMWYGVAGPPNEIGYATSLDGIVWNKYPSPVLSPGPAQDWDDDVLSPMQVFKEDGEYKMWYYGARPGFPHENAMPQCGLATSPDGINWTKYDDPGTPDAPFAYSDPVLKVGPAGAWDSHRAFEPLVLKQDSGGYVMIYTGLKAPVNTSTLQQKGYAYSEDGIHWIKDENNPTIKDDHSFVEWGRTIYSGSVLNFDGKIHYWFACFHTPPYEARPQIGYAVQLTPCFPQDFEFTTQAEIDSFMDDCNNCNEIQGDLTISGADITDLGGLKLLTSVGGDTWFRNNDVLTSLAGLDNLSSINGSLIIGGWWPFANKALQSLDGLNNLTSVGGSMGVANNPLLKNLMGLEGLNSIGGGLRIGNCDAKGRNDDTRLIYSDSLQSLIGLENLVTIGGILSLECNSSLASLEGLENLYSIGGLSIWTPVTSLKELDNLSYIGDQGVWIGGTDLSSLKGLDNVTSFGSGIFNISNNEFLCECDVQSICDYLINPAGETHIEDNAPGCNSVEEVEEDCNNNCLAEGITFYSQDDINNFSAIHQGCLEIEGSVRIIGTDITNLDSLNKITSIGGDLTISECPNLTNLTGLDSLDFIGGKLTIKWNDQLSTCDVDGICKYLDNPSGNISIHDNAPGCNSQEEVVEACAYGVDQLDSWTVGQLAIKVFPNPASGVSSFEFRVPGSGNVTVKIYDLHGREVATVVDQMMPAGKHVVSFDASQLPPGIYIFRISHLASHISNMGKLVVVR